MKVMVVPKDDCQDEYLDSKEHKVAMALHAVRSSVGALFELSSDSDALALIEQDLGDVYGAQLALNLIASRAKS